MAIDRPPLTQPFPHMATPNITNAFTVDFEDCYQRLGSRIPNGTHTATGFPSGRPAGLCSRDANVRGRSSSSQPGGTSPDCSRVAAAGTRSATHGRTQTLVYKLTPRASAMRYGAFDRRAGRSRDPRVGPERRTSRSRGVVVEHDAWRVSGIDKTRISRVTTVTDREHRAALLDQGWARGAGGSDHDRRVLARPAGRGRRVLRIFPYAFNGQPSGDQRRAPGRLLHPPGGWIRSPEDPLRRGSPPTLAISAPRSDAATFPGLLVRSMKRARVGRRDRKAASQRRLRGTSDHSGHPDFELAFQCVSQARHPAAVPARRERPAPRHSRVVMVTIAEESPSLAPRQSARAGRVLRVSVVPPARATTSRTTGSEGVAARPRTRRLEQCARVGRHESGREHDIHRAIVIQTARRRRSVCEERVPGPAPGNARSDKQAQRCVEVVSGS